MRSGFAEAERSIGAVLRADVDGQIMMRAYLSGTPECKFGLNDKLVLQKRCVEDPQASACRLIPNPGETPYRSQKVL